MDDRLKQLTEKKQQLDKLQPLPKDVVTNLEEWFKVELTYSSNAIEGNALSRIETAEVIERGTAAVISGKPLRDQLEAINHGYPMAVIRNEDRTQYLDVIYQVQTKNITLPYYDFIENAVDRSLDAYINAAKGEPVMAPLKASQKPSSDKLLRIGELAQLTSEPVATLRFWTKERLLEVKELTPGGYQLFKPSMVDRVKKIRKLQDERRLTIAEIRKELT